MADAWGPGWGEGCGSFSSSAWAGVLGRDGPPSGACGAQGPWKEVSYPFRKRRPQTERERRLSAGPWAEWDPRGGWAQDLPARCLAFLLGPGCFWSTSHSSVPSAQLRMVADLAGWGEGPLVSPRWVCVGKRQPRRRLCIRARRWPACLLQVWRGGKWSRPTCLETQHPSLLDPGSWHLLSSLSSPAAWGLSLRGVAQLPGLCLRTWASGTVADSVRPLGQRPPELPAPPPPAARSAHVTPLSLPSASSSVKWV